MMEHREHKGFSARFRRSNKKTNGTTSRATSPVTAPSPPTSTTPPDDGDSLDVPNKPSGNRAAPPVLTITTTNTPPRSSHGDSHNLFHPPKSPFRNFHFRSSNKRARSPAPASFSQPSSPAVKQNGTAEHDMISPIKTPAKGRGDGGANGSPRKNVPGWRPQPRIPAFLTMGEEEMLSKYSEITWGERNRILQAAVSTSSSHKFARVDSSFRCLDRYNNIQPFSNNRVKLQVPEGAPDYINASPITLHSPLNPKGRPQLKYIAMQGPIARTSEHVWRMVSEQLKSPAVMVMLTETHENNIEKCYPYFPHSVDDTIEIGEEDEFQDGFRAQIKCTDIESRAEGAIEMRKLVLQVEGRDDLEVWHLLYKRWPDFGVPALEDIDSFLELMRLSREKNADEDNPRIVHCSAGVGRSGTFMALEHLMREIDSGDLDQYDEVHGANAPDLVHDTVNALREQRKMMVQAEPQYIFIYQVLRKQWMEKYGMEDDGDEPAAKRLEVGTDPFVEDN